MCDVTELFSLSLFWFLIINWDSYWDSLHRNFLNTYFRVNAEFFKSNLILKNIEVLIKKFTKDEIKLSLLSFQRRLKESCSWKNSNYGKLRWLFDKTPKGIFITYNQLFYFLSAYRFLSDKKIYQLKKKKKIFGSQKSQVFEIDLRFHITLYVYSISEYIWCLMNNIMFNE